MPSLRVPLAFLVVLHLLEFQSAIYSFGSIEGGGVYYDTVRCFFTFLKQKIVVEMTIPTKT